MVAKSWKVLLQDQMPEGWAEEIDVFDGQIELMKQGKLDEKVFAETRLRRGAYGQRYDNGQRHDGVETRALSYPDAALFKGPDTIWHAPGMLRIKIPFGGVTPRQMEVLSVLGQEYSDNILHVTTRQDIQLHYIHIEDTPDIMRRLAAVGITTREACGNSVRNVTCCPIAGVCRDEKFDTTPYANALAFFLLGHDDVQDFGRKFKIAFSGCSEHGCGLAKMHDLGFIARTKVIDGVTKRGFAMYVGGGLGTVPQQAKLLTDFASEEEVFPITQAVCRIFARLGEKRNRNRARIKFLVEKLGIEELRRLVKEELPTIPPDQRWTGYLEEVEQYDERPLKPSIHLNGQARPDGFDEWYGSNVYHQRQEGYATVTINLPLGDFTAEQGIRLADIARQYCGGHIRFTVEQNIVLRWISEADLPALYLDLKAEQLATPGAGTIVDITTCPGTDTCKLGIASSRGLAGELRTRLTAKSASLPDAIKSLRIKVSGCFNSCGQHHLADLGFYGNSRRAGNRKVPHFQVVLGGQWDDNGGSYGLAVGAVPAKRVPDVLDAITDHYANGRERGESFKSWVSRLGTRGARELIQPFMTLPVYEEQPQFFTDWGDVREYTIGDIGVGECAGEVVSLFSFEIAQAESQLFEAQIALDEGNFGRADELAYRAMVLAARSLVRVQFLDVGHETERIVEEFKSRFVETKLFYDQYAHSKFANYFLDRHKRAEGVVVDREVAHHLIEEGQLFIEAVHSCEAKLTGLASAN